jgi:hypothetical protein
MVVPKLVRKVPYASCLTYFVCVDRSLSCYEHNQDTQLRLERDFGKLSEIMLLQTRQILKFAENGKFMAMWTGFMDLFSAIKRNF